MKVGKTLITEEDIHRRLVDMGAEITADYEGKDLLLVAVLKGAFMVMADLARNIALPVDIDFMAVSSYGAATQTSRQLRSVSAPLSHMTISLIAKALGAMLIASAVSAPARLATISPASVKSAIPPVRPAISASRAIAPPAPISAKAGSK